MADWSGKDRRAHVWLTDDQINDVAERAAEKAIERVYTEIGRSVVKKVLWVVGAGALALFVWMRSKGLV
jgi:hypothetical protein